MDLNAFMDSLQSGFAAIPAVAIALGLLAGPTLALIGYRLFAVTRRAQRSSLVEVAPLWVCHPCRSANDLRVSRCYRCGAERDRTDQIEIVVDQPAIRPMPAEVPAGSPFATVAMGGSPGAGVPVMAGRETLQPPIPVGPGQTAEPTAVSPDLEPTVVKAGR